MTFWALAIYIAASSVAALQGEHRPDSSITGIALAIASFIAMQLLGRAKRAVGHAMENDALEADAEETLLCSYLAAVVLIGLVLNGVAGWWWADPTAALVIAALAVREGLEAWRGGHHAAGRSA